MNKVVFNAYVKYMRKTAYAYNHASANRPCKRRWSKWSFAYFTYAKIAIRLAHQLPKEHRINFERFTIYDKTKNFKAFEGTLEQARELL